MAQQDYIKTSVNNALRDPLQGFDVDVYIQDQATGAQLINSRFTSFQFTARNATEPYMEFNQRVMRLLDGEFQFGWVLESGLVDIRVLESTFGLSYMGRELRLSRSPRFQITVELNAPELDESVQGSEVAPPPKTEIVTGLQVPSRQKRAAVGRYRLMYAKTDSLTLGMSAGRQVLAVRWEGLCEGIAYDGSTKTNVTPGSVLPRAANQSFYDSQSVLNTYGAESVIPQWSSDLFQVNRQ